MSADHAGLDRAGLDGAGLDGAGLDGAGLDGAEGIVVCRFADLAPNSAQRFVVAGRPIAIVRIGDDLYALGDTCSHADVSLSEGEVLCDSLEIECWKHGSAFSLVTGEPQTLPATQPVPVFAVREQAGDVVVTIEPSTTSTHDSGAA